MTMASGEMNASRFSSSPSLSNDENSSSFEGSSSSSIKISKSGSKSMKTGDNQNLLHYEPPEPAVLVNQELANSDPHGAPSLCQSNRRFSHHILPKFKSVPRQGECSPPPSAQRTRTGAVDDFVLPPTPAFPKSPLAERLEAKTSSSSTVETTLHVSHHHHESAIDRDAHDQEQQAFVNHADALKPQQQSHNMHRISWSDDTQLLLQQGLHLVSEALSLPQRTMHDMTQEVLMKLVERVDGMEQKLLLQQECMERRWWNEMAREPWDPVHALPKFSPSSPATATGSYPDKFPMDRQSLLTLPMEEVDRLCAFYQLPCVHNAAERHYLRRAMLLQHLGVRLNTSPS